MKNLLLLLIFISSFCFSQTYQPFPTQNNAWVENYYGMQTNCGVTQYYTSGDTVINNLTYHKLRQYYNHRMSDFFGNCNGPLSIGDFLKGCYRNDSLNKRVLWVNSGDNFETILYRFDFSLGDTLNNCDLFNGQIVTAIDSILIGANYHKRFKIDSCQTGHPFDNNYLIEGVGSSRGLFQDINCPFEQFHDLTCFITDSFSHDFDTLISPTCSYVSIEEIQLSLTDEITIFPNPIEKILKASFQSNKFEYIEIIDLSGRMMFKQKILGKAKLEINLESLSKGTYIILFKRPNGILISKKIIKK